MMRTIYAALLLASTALLSPASAETIDPLHGLVCTSASSCTNSGDNNSFTPLGNGGTNFGFSISPGPQTGNLTLVIGVPTDEINVGTFNLPGLQDNGGGLASSVFSRVNLFNVGSPVLSAYLGIAGAFTPTDSFTNLSAGTSTFDPGFGGNFLVFTVTLPNVTIGDNGGCGTTCATTQDFSFGSNLPGGSFIAGLFINPTGDHGGPDFIGTAASAHLVTTQFNAVPAPIVGAGIPGLVAACGGLFGLNFWRRRRNGGTLPA